MSKTLILKAFEQFADPLIDYCVLMTEFTADGGDGFAMIPQGTKYREQIGGDLGKRT